MVYRLIVLALMLCASSLSIYFRSQAGKGANKVSSAKEPHWLRIPLRSAGLLGFLAILAFITGYGGITWSYWPSPVWLRLLGVGLGIVSVPLLAWMLRALGKNITPTVATRPDHQLVTDGPYRWIRHPLYTFGSLFYIAIALICQSWLILGIWAVAFLLLYLRLPLEEAELQKRFGEEYDRYKQRTGRFFPRLNR